MKLFALLLLVLSNAGHAQQYTRGVGMYPGDPREYMGPEITVDAKTYRNLALHRAAYQSSAYDYNLTAQLVTDGIEQQALPQWIVASTSAQGTLEKQEREVFLDGNTVSSIDVPSTAPDGKAWVQFELAGGGEAPEFDRLDLSLRRMYGPPPPGGWAYRVLGSDDGAAWIELGRLSGTDWPKTPNSDPSFTQTISLSGPSRSRFVRVELAAGGVTSWPVAELSLFDKGQPVPFAGPANFQSAWKSAGSGEEWVYVDLGARCAFDKVRLAWIRRAAEGLLQVSDDAQDWRTLQPLPASDEIGLSQPAQGRYVRVLMTRAADLAAGYILSEIEVFGRGGPVAMTRPALAARADGTRELARGKWRLERASQVAATGEQLSALGFADNSWMPATVPGTVLASYLNDGAIPDPNFGDNQYAVSDSFFCADFWYRDEFLAPANRLPDEHQWLNFDGINWKADVYLNGHFVGRIDGGFMRGRFDVTALLHPGAANALAVLVIADAHPGSTKDKAHQTINGGVLGLDNPTYHASAGWDWIPTIRGRNTGIWAPVILRATSAVIVEDPLVTTALPLPETTKAEVTIQATIHNLDRQPVSGVLRAHFGNAVVEQPVTLDASSAKSIQFSPATYPALRLDHPKLWWPVGYGDPNLYPVKIEFVAGGRVSDSTAFLAGVRQFTYSEDGGVLKMWINGRRFVARGGNWGFSESMLRYRSREYETAMRYHRDEHFTMIRNWVGQIGDEAFYDAADRNGVVIWQDFWLANPWDGPNPDNDALFLANAKDYLLRIRNHASLGLFCGRNEGFPPAEIDDGLRKLVGDLEPGSHYIGSSADGPVSGHGPYRVEPLKYYFEHAPEKFHSEIGSPNVVTLESLRRTMPESALWPQSSQWPLHDFHGRNPFAAAIDQQYGGGANLEDWAGLAQFVDYNAYRGMFESQSSHRYGLLIWMSHPAWPSLLWQTYDYFYDTDAGYFGAKKAAEPLHIQWNAATDAVEVVNYSAGNLTGLSAHAEILNLDGKLQWEKTAALDSPEDSTVSPIQLEFPANLSPTHFLRLTLSQAGKSLSTNFYLHCAGVEDYRAIRSLPAAQVEAATRVTREGNRWRIETTLHNASEVPALMVRIKAVRERTGDPILPALYDDNYIALMPGERRTLNVTLEDADTRGERPRVSIQGFNLRESSTAAKPNR